MRPCRLQTFTVRSDELDGLLLLLLLLVLLHLLLLLLLPSSYSSPPLLLLVVIITSYIILYQPLGRIGTGQRVLSLKRFLGHVFVSRRLVKMKNLLRDNSRVDLEISTV